MNTTKNTRYCLFSLKTLLLLLLSTFPFFLVYLVLSNINFPFFYGTRQLFSKKNGIRQLDSFQKRKKKEKKRATGLHADAITSLEHECAKAGTTMHSYHCCCCRERERESWARLWPVLALQM